jgi:hypothetical protein
MRMNAPIRIMWIVLMLLLLKISNHQPRGTTVELFLQMYNKITIAINKGDLLT